MQNRYACDIGDIGKYALLRALSEQNVRLGVVWYLNPDEEGNSDGGFTSYTELRECDNYLYDSLQTLLRARKRSVAAIEQAAILPSGTQFCSEPLSFRDLPTSNARARLHRRDQWLRMAVAAVSGTDLVFLDPDYGFAPDSVSRAANAGQKYVFREEIAAFINRGQSIVIYHHHARHERLKDQLDRHFRMLRARGGQRVWALTFHRRSLRTFFVVAAAQHAVDLWDRSRQFMSSIWGQRGHFQLHTPEGDWTGVVTVQPTTPQRDEPLLKSAQSPPTRVSRSTTAVGYENRHRQVVIRSTGLRGTDHCQSIYVLRCSDCKREYGANGSDIFQRRCPFCQDGRTGLSYVGS